MVEVVAPVALLPGIALSHWIEVRYGSHRRKVVISLRSTLPGTSSRLGAPFPFLNRSSSRGLVTANTPHPSRSLWGWPPSTWLPPRTRGLPLAHPPHVLLPAPRPGSIWLGYIYLPAWMCSVISILWDR